MTQPGLDSTIDGHLATIRRIMWMFAGVPFFLGTGLFVAWFLSTWFYLPLLENFLTFCCKVTFVVGVIASAVGILALMMRGMAGRREFCEPEQIEQRRRLGRQWGIALAAILGNYPVAIALVVFTIGYGSNIIVHIRNELDEPVEIQMNGKVCRVINADTKQRLRFRPSEEDFELGIGRQGESEIFLRDYHTGFDFYRAAVRIGPGGLTFDTANAF